MIMGANTTISRGVTSVDCQKQVRSWRLLRTIIALLIPTCNHTKVQDQPQESNDKDHHPRLSNSATSSSTITGTIFGFRHHGKANLCIQTKTNNLILELAVPTTTLAKEMQGGTLRIALQSKSTRAENSKSFNSESILMSTAQSWTMYCNGRKVGYAIKRKASKADLDALRMMNLGVGTISGKELIGCDSDDEILYLRAKYKRNRGAPNSESFHLVDPDGNFGQELSILFFCSQ